MTTEDLDETTLSTLSLLESRLLRVEHLLHGQSGSQPVLQNGQTTLKLGDLERQFNGLVSKVRVYADLLKIYKTHPDFFRVPDASEPPSQLSPDAVSAIVLASASSYQSTLSTLTAIKDTSIPDPSASAALIALSDRMKALEATQLAQAAEVAELRTRSEAVIRSWYESSVLGNAQFMADVEGRIEKVERQVRRAEREREEDDEI